MAGSSGHQSSHKKLLQNYIRHASAHNKIKEESKMWQMRQRELASDQTDYKLKSREKRKHSDSEHSLGQTVSDRSDCHGNVYQRELMKMKEADPTRWGHSGYKELYPEDFVSSESCGSEEEGERHRARVGVKARKRSVQDPEDSSHKKRRKETKRKKSKKSKTEKELQEKKSKKKKHLKRKRHNKVTESPSSSQSSDNGKR